MRLFVVIPVILQKEKTSGEAQTIGRLYFEADRLEFYLCSH